MGLWIFWVLEPEDLYKWHRGATRAKDGPVKACEREREIYIYILYVYICICDQYCPICLIPDHPMISQVADDLPLNSDIIATPKRCRKVELITNLVGSTIHIVP